MWDKKIKENGKLRQRQKAWFNKAYWVFLACICGSKCSGLVKLFGWLFFFLDLYNFLLE